LQVQDALGTLPPGILQPAQLAGIDQFHVRGLPATEELASLVRIDDSSSVLDAGSGLGGSSRYLAHRFGCSVTGVDLTPSYVAISELLTERTGLTDRVKFQVGNLTNLEFPAAAFDLVWTQHVVMNIRERDEVEREFHRVLKPGGALVFYDIIAADDRPDPHYPVPWSETVETSFLLTKAETVAGLVTAGFSIEVWNDVTQATLAWFGQQQASASAPVTLASILGPRFNERVANLGRNFREGRLRLVMGVAKTKPLFSSLEKDQSCT
jgi:ubiquinone/menaquinone biosynthesis C-methylase UbiE